MSDRMRPVPFRDLLGRILAEYRSRGTVFDFPREHFWEPVGKHRAPIFSGSAANPVGPAAGPHTQLAQNIVVAWLAGGRYIELKTVQKLDSLTVEKPCIDAHDEGWNVEWSTELSLEQAWDEYLKAWVLVHALPSLLGLAPAGAATLFNMSVGYDLAGIRSEPMDRFIGRLIDCSGEPLLARYRGELAALARREPSLDGLAAAADGMTGKMCASVTLSTMHGCPPGEIESICAYMLAEKGLDTLVKLNPTLLGHEKARAILDGAGWTAVQLHPEGFLKDLQRADAVPMLTRLLALGREKGRHFGAKLSNTLAAGNHRGVLPGGEMYMSGRALYPLTVELAASLAAEFDGGLPMSFCGGAAAWNVGALLDAGVRPVTLATDLLKPGGCARLTDAARAAEAHARGWARPRVDAAALRRAAGAALASPRVRKAWRGEALVRVDGPLPAWDCFVAPCVEACAIHQDVPEYVHLAGAGRWEEALGVVLSRNPLPFMTGWLCDQKCAGTCTRMDWEGAVRIREMKRITAEHGFDAVHAGPGLAVRGAPPRGVKAAVLGAGPAGIAAAHFLAREGFETHVFERAAGPGGIVRWVLPSFRIPHGAVEKDVALAESAGAVFHYGQSPAPAVASLRAEGFRWIVVGIGAEKDRDAGVAGALDVLAFLRAFREDPHAPRLGARVVVVGAGDTAMDAARAARRCRGVKEVRVVYRREEKDMPASPEEYSAALTEGIAFSFLRAPVRWSKQAGLSCSVMRPGPADARGRAVPVPTGEEEAFPADTVITAVGAEVDGAALAALGVPPGEADALTQESRAEGVFVVGDAARGPETIVKGIASARRAVDAILAREGGMRAPAWPLPPENTEALRAARDRSIAASSHGADDDAVRAAESARCLGCRALCLKCVEVCPNRANTAVAVEGFRDAVQVVHLDALCNECGNCATFCPWDGKPYRDKPTVFAAEEDFRDSANPGFFVAGGAGLLRTAAGTFPLRVTGPAGTAEAAGADPRALAVVRAVVAAHPWLLGAGSDPQGGPA